ncbi:hypothetical protein ACJMK2_008312 [Sinanodonta woodiana]|uniref:C-type lectin domain-containing protein n=1 Tax=Sinanodonta woodiana TaxID=1069815 RepID=A0ABD3VLQ6_SINWO
MNVSQFDNDNTTAQFVREKLSNIHGEIWLGAVKLSNGWNWINGPKFTDVWTKNIISTSQDNRNETCLILVSSIQSFSSMACEKKFSVLCQDSSGIQKTAINSSSRIVASTVTVSGTKTFETETLPMPTSLRLEFSILNANNESNITKTTSTILTTPNSYGPLPLTQPGLNFSFAATAVVKTTPKPFTIKNGGFNFWTPLTQSLHTLYSTKTPKTVSDREKKQFNETAVYTANFCVPSSRGEVCYYYFEVRRNLLEAVALCRGLGMEIFHFDNNNAVAQSVREHLVKSLQISGQGIYFQQTPILKTFHA